MAAVAVVTTVLIPARERINSTSVALAFVLAVLLVATLLGSRPALVTSLLAAFSLNFFFLPPYYTLTIAGPENWIALAVFLIVALTVGQLSATARRRAEIAEKLYSDLDAAFEQASQAEAIRRSEKLKSALLDAVTHDLRTPLTSIKAATTMLIEEQNAIHSTLDPDAQSELLDVIDEETDRLNSFVESMVELAQLESGATEQRVSKVDVEDMLRNVVQRASNITSRHQVSVDIAPDTPSVHADERALAEGLYNLIDNAAKYSPPGTSIRITAARHDNGIRFAVEDEGPGVGLGDREKIFDKFHRGNKRVKGFGLGLAIVRGIIDAHGGRVFVEDAVPSGARFVIELPNK
jgi:two-component system sensor histidine kinase KdpD